MERTVYCLLLFLHVLPFLCFAQSQEPCTVNRLHNGAFPGRRITYNHGENITFTCFSGYEQQYERYWCDRGSALPGSPRCVPASCNAPHLPDHMISSQSRFAHGSFLNVSCEYGFRLSAYQQQPRCWLGDWTRSLDATCQRVPCPEPGSDSLSTVEALSIPGIQGYVHRARVRYSCIEGWEIQGIAERECDNGHWTGIPPTCRIAAPPRCMLPERSNGERYYVTGYTGNIFDEGLPIGESADISVRCNPGSVPQSAVSATCLNRGVWSVSVPICERMQRLCSKPGYISRVVQYVNGLEINELTSYPHDELPEGTFLTSHCSLPGQYVLQGGANRTCSDGRWTGMEPRCVSSQTQITFYNNQPLEIRSDGTIVIYPRGYLRIDCRVPSTKAAHFSSDSGEYGHYWANYGLSFMAMTLNPPRTSQSGRFTCRSSHNSLSHSVFIQFAAIQCDRPIVPTNGELHDYDFGWKHGTYYMGKFIAYTCNSGYRLDGERRITCVFGQWSDPVPTCKRATCPELQPPIHGTKIGGNRIGDSVMIGCNYGYQLQGETFLDCLESGEWSHPLPNCTEVGIPNNCNPDLQFIETPQNEIHSEGDFVNPKCRVNDEEMIVTWHKDGQKLDLGGTNDIIVDQFNDLYIPSFDSRHEGHYACVVFAGDDTECLRAEANLTLNPLSFFSHLPEDSYIDMETVGIVTFMCSPADETWEIVWEKDGEPLEDPFTVNGNLVLQDIEEADEGKYTCVVRDPWGRSTGRADAWLFLNDPPLIDISAVCGTITPMLDNTNPTVTPELSSVEEWSSFSMMGQPGDDDGNEARSSRIVGGTTAEFGSAPYMVQISELRDREWTNICGGTLLDQQWVLTAAHCMFEEDTHIPIQNDNMRLLFGEYDTLVQEDSELLRRPAAIIVHEEYRPDERTFDNDIALIRIEPPIREFTTSIRPICLAPYTLSSRLMRNSVLGRVTGWGRQVFLGPRSRFLKEVAVPFVDRHTCQESVDDDEGVFTENMFCAGYHSAQRDACSGDSGGPLAVRYDDGRWYQLGIVSWGIRCAEEGEYGFYTHVSRFLHWLRSKNVTVAYSSEVGVRFNNSRGSGVLAFTVRSRSNLTVMAGSTVDLECVPNRDDASVEWFIGNSPEPVNMLVDGVRILPSGLVFHFDAIVEEFAGAYSCVARLDDGEGEQVIRADFQIQVTPA